MYCRIDLTTVAILSGPVPLPAELAGLADDSLADLSWADPALGYAGVGLWPVMDEFAPLAPGQLHGAPGEPVPDAANTRVVRLWPAVDGPASPEPAPVPLTLLQFRQLWTFDERVLMDNPDLATGLDPVGRAQIRTLLMDLSASSEILLDHPQVVAGVNMVVGLGLISAERGAAILAGEPPPS